MKPYVLVKPLADYLTDCDPRRLLRMIHNGSLQAYRVGREWRIPVDAAVRAFHLDGSAIQAIQGPRPVPHETIDTTRHQ